MTRSSRWWLALALAAPMTTALANAQNTSVEANASAPANATAPANETPAERESRLRSVATGAGRIASQPARDVGVTKTDIPPVLLQAAENPYSLKGTKTCRAISASFHALTDVMGPDLKPGDTKRENRAGKLAEAGGKTVVNSLIPFRGLVREVTGAAPAQRRYERALGAGLARRGFLRGMHVARQCRTKLF